MIKSQKVKETIKMEKRYRALHSKVLCSWDFAHDNGEDPKAMQFAKNYVRRFPKYLARGGGLFLYGSPGSGKTYMAAAIVNELTDQGYRCHYTSMLTLMNTLSCTAGEAKLHYLSQCWNTQLLVLDSFGMEMETSYSTNILNFIVDNCRQRRVLVIVITPFHPDVLAKENSNDKRSIGVHNLMDRCLLRTVYMPGSRRAAEYWQKKQVKSEMGEGIAPEQGTLPLAAG